MEPPKADPTKPEPEPEAPLSEGATEDQVDMADTIPEHIDDCGTKLEPAVGLDEIDSLGG